MERANVKTECSKTRLSLYFIFEHRSVVSGRVNTEEVDNFDYTNAHLANVQDENEKSASSPPSVLLLRRIILLRKINYHCANIRTSTSIVRSLEKKRKRKKRETKKTLNDCVSIAHRPLAEGTDGNRYGEFSRKSQWIRMREKKGRAYAIGSRWE